MAIYSLHLSGILFSERNTAFLWQLNVQSLIILWGGILK